MEILWFLLPQIPYFERRLKSFWRNVDRGRITIGFKPNGVLLPISNKISINQQIINNRLIAVYSATGG